MSRAQVPGPGPPWWHGAVIYQLYVRSWRDSNGDEYGDLRGIIEHLDHLSWLGVDAVWLSPIMPTQPGRTGRASYQGPMALAGHPRHEACSRGSHRP